MRWTRHIERDVQLHARGRTMRCVRRSRVVLTPRRWRQVRERRCRPLARHVRTLANDGGKKARSPGRARRKPLKPLRRECRLVSGEPVVTNSCAFSFRTRGCGCIGHPAFPAPSFLSRVTSMHSSDANCVAGMRGRVCYSDVMPVQKREARLRARCRGHPRLASRSSKDVDGRVIGAKQSFVASPAMTKQRRRLSKVPP
jgi:hypothetical protein